MVGLRQPSSAYSIAQESVTQPPRTGEVPSRFFQPLGSASAERCCVYVKMFRLEGRAFLTLLEPQSRLFGHTNSDSS